MERPIRQAAEPGMTRPGQIDAFLASAGWADAERKPIPGDASFRRYARLRRGGEEAILMDAPPEHENTQSFVAAQSYLLAAGFRAPRLIAGDAEQGMLLLEDFGDRSVSLALRENAGEEEAIYTDAVALLAEIHRHGLTQVPGAADFPPYDVPLLTRELELLPEWFLPEILSAEALANAHQEFSEIWAGLIAKADLAPQVFVHRDYHADNLFLLAGETGPSRIGLLDFQDAVAGRPAYDLVSLLADARRDVSPEIAQRLITRFANDTGIDEERLRAEFALYNAQRNAKILGIFTRLFRRDGKPRYLDLLPRVWAHFTSALEHPDLAELKAWQARYIPPQTAARLQRLRAELTGA